MTLWTSNFRELKKERRLTFKEISEGSGVAVNALQRFQNSEGISLNTAIRIAALFDCTLNDLINLPKRRKVTPAPPLNPRHTKHRG